MLSHVNVLNCSLVIQLIMYVCVSFKSPTLVVRVTQAKFETYIEEDDTDYLEQVKLSRTTNNVQDDKKWHTCLEDWVQRLTLC